MVLLLIFLLNLKYFLKIVLHVLSLYLSEVFTKAFGGKRHGMVGSGFEQLGLLLVHRDHTAGVFLA